MSRFLTTTTSTLSEMVRGVRLGHFRLDYVYGFKFNEEALANVDGTFWTHQINMTVPMQFASTQE